MKEFQSTEEATEFMEKLQSMLNDERLTDWAYETDSNFSVDTTPDLNAAREAFSSFLNKMYEA